MERPADFSVMETDGGRRAVLSGDWTATAAGDAGFAAGGRSNRLT